MRTILGPHVIEVETELIDVSVMSAPDPAWTFIDAAGHGHAWVFDAEHRAAMPTCEQHTVHAAIGDPDDEWYEPPVWIWRCVQCKETIHPGTRAEQAKMKGLTTIYIDGRRATEPQVRELIVRYTKDQP